VLSPKRATALISGGLVTAALCLAQVAISTHSGLVQFTLGSVYLEDKPFHKTTTNLIEVKPQQVLRTDKDGFAEVLLTPGVFLRIGNQSSIRMEQNALTNTRVALLTGSAMVECDELLADNAVSFLLGNQLVQIRKKGLYRLEADPAAVGVIKGDAFVAGNVNVEVKQGKLLQLASAVPQVEKFHVDKKEELYAFTQSRSEDSAYATGVSSASLYSSGFTGAGCTSSNWYFMNTVGMYSYLPCGGMMSNAFGYNFLGLSSGYLWNGPMYYMAPYALYGGYGYGGYYGNGFYGGGGGGFPANTNGNRPGATPAGSAVAAGRTPAKVPVYTVPGYRGPIPTVAGGRPSGFANPRPATMSSPAGIRSMAGPAIGARSVGSSVAGRAPVGGGGGGAMMGAPSAGGARPSAGMSGASMGGARSAAGARSK
jgi:hypothetical protein